MELSIARQNFIVCGASDGLGKAIALALLNEGACVLGIARNPDKLKKIADAFPERFNYFIGDISSPEILSNISNYAWKQKISGLVLNAGGPPATRIDETSLVQWDEAYRSVLRWKVELVAKLLPVFKINKYGRILFIESVSVKQPVENLVLSNSLRLAVVGFAKTLAQEIAKEGITVNILAPGYHDTFALQRVIQKKAELMSVSNSEAKESLEREVPVGYLGTSDQFASLAAWLLSNKSGYITGQTISVDGGVVKGVMG